jgi:hypothetical protein
MVPVPASLPSSPEPKPKNPAYCQPSARAGSARSMAQISVGALTRSKAHMGRERDARRIASPFSKLRANAARANPMLARISDGSEKQRPLARISDP